MLHCACAAGRGRREINFGEDGDCGFVSGVIGVIIIALVVAFGTKVVAFLTAVVLATVLTRAARIEGQGDLGRLGRVCWFVEVWDGRLQDQELKFFEAGLQDLEFAGQVVVGFFLSVKARLLGGKDGGKGGENAGLGV